MSSHESYKEFKPWKVGEVEYCWDTKHNEPTENTKCKWIFLQNYLNEK